MESGRKLKEMELKSNNVDIKFLTRIRFRNPSRELLDSISIKVEDSKAIREALDPISGKQAFHSPVATWLSGGRSESATLPDPSRVGENELKKRGADASEELSLGRGGKKRGRRGKERSKGETSRAANRR
ncbi:hypothetical protein K0M31_005428 [Melipona bicolor]|uniref:Uncharacterized protein n=1 Tax=Melipona bicolor TaxID=60889 RepID=A0AA40FVR2_9HYME|nr:hypothetical protein K0M31_005428 [Melipona bicolor]